MIFKKIKSSKISPINFILLFYSLIILSIAIFIIIQKTTVKYTTKAANVCGCTPDSSCSINGSYCENFIQCDGTTPIFGVYICSNGRWTFAYPQANGTCPSNCGAPPITFPTQPGGCNCVGGLYNVVFKTSRPLTAGESINCSIKGSGPCSCSGTPCSSGYRERSCGIGPGLSQCAVSGLDCGCKPFNYSCTGTANASGTFTNVTNGGSDTVTIALSAPAQPTITQPTPTRTPSPTTKPTKTPTPTPTTPQATSTPTPTITQTPIPTPTEITPTPPTETPTQSIASQPTPTNTPTLTPTPTEMILALASTAPTEIPTTIPSQAPPQSGGLNNLIIGIPLIFILISLLL